MKVKKSVTIPQELWEEAQKVSGNFSSLIEEALKEYLRFKKLQRAKAAFGAWKERDQDSTHIVQEMRKDESRERIRNPR